MERVAGQDNRHWVESEETARQRVEQVKSLKEQACKGGLRFEAYLTADLAEWILDMVERCIRRSIRGGVCVHATGKRHCPLR